MDTTSHLKKVVCPDLCAGPGFQVLDMQAYASGLKPESALILNQNPFSEMACIKLQKMTKALNGNIEAYWFENKNFDLEKTLIHRIIVPLKPFDSGLEYEDQPVKTEIVFDWFNLGTENLSRLEGLDLNHVNYDDAEALVYIGHVYNFCQINSLRLKPIGSNLFKVYGDIIVEFENEGLARNEPFTFEAEVEYGKA